MRGDGLLEFAGSGEIPTIASGAAINLFGPQAFVADAALGTTSNSALTGLTSYSGTLSLQDGASLTTTGGLDNSGALDVNTGGSGGSRVFWTEGNPPTVVDNGLAVADPGSATLTGATVAISSGFLAGDQLNFTNQNGITGSYDASTGVLTLTGASSVADYQQALASVSYSSTSTSPSAAGADSIRTIAWQAANGPAISNTVTSTIDVGQVYRLTTGVDTIHAGAGNDIIIATTNTLNPGDVIDGGGGNNTLALSGAGAFNLAAPTTLADIAVIAAQEGQAAYSGSGKSFAAQNQIVDLRAGLNATVDVSPDSAVNPGNPDAPTITIVGANNSDVIDLASGNDVVTVGSAAETVNLGSGNDTISVNASTIGATIGDGTGNNTLDVSGGGTMAMGANIDGISTVLLSAAASAYNFTANAQSGLTVDDQSTGADTLTAGGANQTLTGGAAGKLTMIGAAAGSDLFQDTAALLNDDTIEDFAAPADAIDFTNVKDVAGVIKSFTENSAGTAGTLNVSDGTHTASVTLFGQFLASGFAAAADGGGLGTIITYQQPTHTALAPPHA